MSAEDQSAAARQMRHKAQLLPRVNRLVVKLGSSILSTVEKIDRSGMQRLVGELAELAARYELVVVSSGAVAAGLGRLGFKQRPHSIPLRQAAAAVGQIGLMALYEEYFGAHGHPVAQILLTHDDLAHRQRYLNARHTFAALVQRGVIPIVNENDTVAIDEMRFTFGDNDNLSALVATLVDADLLVILSDVAGLYTRDPGVDPQARLVPLVAEITDAVRAQARSGTGRLGRGGMESKIEASRKANEAGIPCLIADGLHAGVLRRVFDPLVCEGTLFLPAGDRLTRRKHWIAHTLRPAGALGLDRGATEALMRAGRSLLPRGIVTVTGHFGSGDCVSCLDPEGHEFARGLVAYSSAELALIQGLHSEAIEATLGYRVDDEVIHRNDLVLLR